MVHLSIKQVLNLVLPLLIVLVLFSNNGFAQDKALKTDLNLSKYWDLEEATDAQISPNGEQIIYTRRHIDKNNDRWENNLWIMNSDGSRHRFLIKGSDVRWSPDGTRIAYIVQDDDKRPQIFIRWMDAEGAVTQVTRGEQRAGNISWSPDSKILAFRANVEPAKPKWKIDMPKPPKGAKWTPAPRIVDKLYYRQDRVGFLPEGYNHIFVVSADGGTARQVTEGEWHVGSRGRGGFGGSLDWTPDSQNIVFTKYSADTVDTGSESHIAMVNLDTGDVTQLTETAGNWNNARVSPNGKLIAYTGHTKLVQSWAASELYIMNIDGSDKRKLTEDSPDTVRPLVWANNGRGIYAQMRANGQQNLMYISSNGDSRAVTEGVHVLSTDSISKSGRAAGTLTTPVSPRDVVSFDLRRANQINQLTDLNSDLLYGVRVAEAEEIWYDSSDNTKVQGWVFKPHDFDPNKKYPLWLVIHGGPHAMYDVRFRYDWQNWAANGYVVLATNPRGSTGYGTAFANAIDKDYPGRRDYDDLMAGVDHVIAEGYVDTDRLYIEGCSGGGILTLWAIAQTDRFAAATSRCPVTNWLSVMGQTDISYSPYHQFSTPYWEDPSRWLERSPLMHVGKVSTPTLLLTGVKDMRTPVEQSESYYAALKFRGVPTKMVRMNEEWHNTVSKPTNFIRTQLYILSWWEQWNKGGAVANQKVSQTEVE